MRIAVMQPYVFPYPPYLQLVHAVDHFVLFDTVQFIRRGWMNRNRIKLDGKDHLITFPVGAAARDTLAKDIVFSATIEDERRKIIATLQHAYRKAPCWGQLEAFVLPLLAKLEPNLNFVDFAEDTLRALMGALGVATPITRASALGPRCGADYQAYLLALCRRLGAQTYVNPIGGLTLYDPQAFGNAGVDLRFLVSDLPPYPQRGEPFIPHLSILDLMGNVPIEGIRAMMPNYQLVDQAGGEGSA